LWRPGAGASPSRGSFVRSKKRTRRSPRGRAMYTPRPHPRRAFQRLVSPLEPALLPSYLKRGAMKAHRPRAWPRRGTRPPREREKLTRHMPRAGAPDGAERTVRPPHSHQRPTRVLVFAACIQWQCRRGCRGRRADGVNILFAARAGGSHVSRTPFLTPALSPYLFSPLGENACVTPTSVTHKKMVVGKLKVRKGERRTPRRRHPRRWPLQPRARSPSRERGAAPALTRRPPHNARSLGEKAWLRICWLRRRL
jgi:hypothetical protein